MKNAVAVIQIERILPFRTVRIEPCGLKNARAGKKKGEKKMLQFFSRSTCAKINVICIDVHFFGPDVQNF